AKDKTVRRWRRPDGELDWKFVAITMEAFQLRARVENRSFTGLEEAGETETVRLPITRGNDGIRHQPADGLGLWPPKDRLRHRVPVGDDPIRVHRDNRVERGIENAAEPPQVLLLRNAGGSPFGRGADFALDDGSQAGEVSLEYVVVRSAAHDRHRGIFTDGPRNDD